MLTRTKKKATPLILHAHRTSLYTERNTLYNSDLGTARSSSYSYLSRAENTSKKYSTSRSRSYSRWQSSLASWLGLTPPWLATLVPLATRPSQRVEYITSTHLPSRSKPPTRRPPSLSPSRKNTKCSLQERSLASVDSSTTHLRSLSSKPSRTPSQ